jgi:hypothetical protein
MKDSFGMWSEEMRQIFDALVDDAYNTLTKNQTKPRDNRAIVLGGLPGAGKSSTLDAMAKQGFHKDDWIIANPDHFKDVIIARGLAPQISGLAPAETAELHPRGLLRDDPHAGAAADGRGLQRHLRHHDGQHYWTEADSTGWTAWTTRSTASSWTCRRPRPGTAPRPGTGRGWTCCAPVSPGARTTPS